MTSPNDRASRPTGSRRGHMSVSELLRAESVSHDSDQAGEDSNATISESIPSRPVPSQDPSQQPTTGPSSVRRTFFDPAREIETDIPHARETSRINNAHPLVSGSVQERHDAQARESSSAAQSSQGSSSPSRFRLTILQQPEAARACGQGERDRRVVDPPPIVQLTMDDFDPSSEEDQRQLRLPSNIVHCTLLSVPQGNDVSAVEDPLNKNIVIRKLMGTQAASSFIGVDPVLPANVSVDHRPGVFYIFTDVSCRHTGVYRLKFDLLPLTAHTNELGTQADVLASVVSNKFEVYNAKDFPCMKASSALARNLKNQGASIPLKKGRRNRNEPEGNVSDD